MLRIYSHPFFNHRCLSRSWKPTLQLSPLPFSGGLRPVHSGKDTWEPLSMATQLGARSTKSRGRGEWGHTGCLVIPIGRSNPGGGGGTSQTWWYQSPWEWWEEMGAADTPSKEFCWRTKCKEDRANDCYHVKEELFSCFRFFFFFLNTGSLGFSLFVCFITFGLSFSMWNLNSPTRDGIQPPALAAWSL